MAASIATRELVSGARLGTSKQRAAVKSRRFRRSPTAPMNRAFFPQLGRICSLKYRWCSS
jgi:hypothetical protein